MFFQCKEKGCNRVSESDLFLYQCPYCGSSHIEEIEDSEVKKEQWSEMGIVAFSQMVDERQKERGVYYFQRAARLGDSTGICNLAWCYENGFYVEEDMTTALWLMEQAVELGNVVAMCNLGYAYEMGEGVEQDYHKAIDLYKKAYEKGSTRAGYYLGRCYLYGLTEVNYEQAAIYFKESAEEGYIPAIVELARCYHLGVGVAQSDAEAVNLYYEAAKRGEGYAQVCLGEMYERGLGFGEHTGGMENHLERAVYWYKQAAEQQYLEGQLHLAKCYAKGIGVETDYDQAEYYVRQTLDENEEGSSAAKKLLNWIEQQKKNIEEQEC